MFSSINSQDDDIDDNMIFHLEENFGEEDSSSSSSKSKPKGDLHSSSSSASCKRLPSDRGDSRQAKREQKDAVDRLRSNTVLNKLKKSGAFSARGEKKEPMAMMFM